MTATKQPKARALMLTKTADLTDFETLLKQCQALPTNYQWALMTHDLDDGTNHYHVAVQAPHPISAKTMANAFATTPNFVQLWRGNIGNMWAYLAHNTKTAADEKADYNHYLTDPTKFATNHPDTTAFTYQPQKNTAGKSKKLQETINKVLLGEMTLKDLLHPDNITYYHDNYNKLNRAIQLRTQSLRYNPPQCQTIYIQGDAGTGKTTYATQLAQTKYPDNWAFASSANDPLQDYTGEKCLILDDWRPKDYELNDLLAMLDPYHRKRTHKSRYYNKPLATELIIITTNTNLDEATEYYTAYNNEDPKQIRRRIHKLITLTNNDKPLIETYDEQLDGWAIP